MTRYRSDRRPGGAGLQESYRFSAENPSVAVAEPTPAALARPPRAAHLPALTGLRFFLALWVIVNHLVGKGNIYEPIAASLPGPLQAIIRGGYQAVPTFFVLSGFVLARTYASTSWNALNAWKYLVGDRKSTRLNSSHVKISYA